MQQSREDLLAAYRSMKTMREFEERMHVEFTTGEVPGFVHLYSGQEASAAGICANLTDKDILTNTHRAHGPAIARGANVTAVAKEIYCRGDGLCRGRGGSAHLHDVTKGLWGANSGVGSGAALACGAAIAMRNRKTGGVVASLCGDGGCNQGVVSEAMNLASIWKLPVVFMVENNGYAESTSSTYSIAGGDVARRAAAFDMPGVIVDGHDYFAVYDAAREAVERARNGGGPSLIEAKQRRYFGHFEGDAQTYRPKGEVDDYRAHKDCLIQFKDRVISAKLLEKDQLDAIDKQVAVVIDQAYKQAKESPLPEETELTRDIYATVI